MTRAIQGKWLSDQVTLGKVRDKEDQTPMYALNAGIVRRSLNGLDPKINPDKPPRNLRDAMKVLVKQAWAAGYNGVSWIQATRSIQDRQTGAGSANPRHPDKVRIQGR